MWFGELATERTAGCILAHGVRSGRRTFKKGHRLSAEDVELLLADGRASVVVARPDPGDVAEDEAAARLAAALAGPGLGHGIDIAAPFTGRVNLFAAAAGVLTLETERLVALNHVDEGITVATLPALARVVPRQMVATVKIIPFAVPAAALERACALGAPAGAGPAIAVRGFAPRRVWLIQTTLAHTKARVLENTEAVTARRVSDLGSRLEGARLCPHDPTALTAEILAALSAGADLVLVIGASAITDRRDVVPEAIVAAGGRIDHFGMPVDPGNLLLLGAVGEVPVLGLPGCARSPKLNGMDWVLERLAAGLPVAGPDIMDMGIGGLLAEVPIRPQPRDAGRSAMTAPHVAALVLAAGQSRRMGAANKLLAEVDGRPLAAHAMQAAHDSGADPVVVVTGHEADRVAALARDMGLATAHNPDHAGGLSTSLRAGLAALPREVDAVLVCLGDMPGITAAHLKRLIAAYAPEEGRAIVVPTVAGKRGNPVLWDRRFFPEMAGLAGDVGARHLIGQYEDLVVEVAFADTAPALDIDTPDELAAARRAAPIHRCRKRIAMTDQDEVYQRAILELARDHTGAGRMEAPDATATVDNPMCGDRVTVDLRLEDGRVTELRHHVRGCLLCEAAAGLLARHAPGADVAELRALPDTVAAFLTDDAATWPERFAEGTAFTPVRPVRNRHRCVTLAFEAVVDALDSAGA